MQYTNSRFRLWASVLTLNNSSNHWPFLKPKPPDNSLIWLTFPLHPHMTLSPPVHSYYIINLYFFKSHIRGGRGGLLFSPAGTPYPHSFPLLDLVKNRLIPAGVQMMSAWFVNDGCDLWVYELGEWMRERMLVSETQLPNISNGRVILKRLCHIILKALQ